MQDSVQPNSKAPLLKTALVVLVTLGLVSVAYAVFSAKKSSDNTLMPGQLGSGVYSSPVSKLHSASPSASVSASPTPSKTPVKIAH